MCVNHMGTGAKETMDPGRGCQSPRTGVSGDYEPPHGYWGAEPGSSAKAVSAGNCWARQPLGLIFLRQGLTVCSRLAMNSCSSCLNFLNSRITVL